MRLLMKVKVKNLRKCYYFLSGEDFVVVILWLLISIILIKVLAMDSPMHLKRNYVGDFILFFTNLLHSG